RPLRHRRRNPGEWRAAPEFQHARHGVLVRGISRIFVARPDALCRRHHQRRYGGRNRRRFEPAAGRRHLAARALPEAGRYRRHPFAGHRHLAHPHRRQAKPLTQLPAAELVSLGVAVGSLAAAFAPAGFFKIAFIAIAAIIAAKLLLGRESWVIGSELPGRAVMRGYGFLMGLASSLMGISGGSLVTMLLTLYRKT